MVAEKIIRVVSQKRCNFVILNVKKKMKTLLTTLLLLCCAFVTSNAQMMLVHTKQGVTKIPLCTIDSVTFSVDDAVERVPQRVLVENYCGQMCTNSAFSYNVLEDIHSQYEDNVVVVNMHAGPFAVASNRSGLTTAVAEDYCSRFLGESAVFPSVLINRNTVTLNCNEWGNAVNEYMQNDCYTEVHTTATYDNSKREVKINSQITSDSNELTYYLWLVEDGITSFQMESDGTVNTTFVHNNVFRCAINGTWGAPVLLQNGVDEVENTFILPAENVAKNCHIIAFVCDEEEVKQVVKIPVISSESYEAKLQTEQKAIQEFIRQNAISVIPQNDFEAKGCTTDCNSNEYVLLGESGVYMQIVRKGCGEKVLNGETCNVLCRFSETNLLTNAILKNTTAAFASMPERFSVTKQNYTFYGSFDSSSSLMANAYGSLAVPAGWLTPFEYINLGRPVSETDELACVRLIIPSAMGQSDAMAKVYPCYYELTFQKAK